MRYACAVGALVLCAVAVEARTVRPQETDEALVNPGMGLTQFHMAGRMWAYGATIPPGDTLAVSVGQADGLPTIALPIARGNGRVYPLGPIEVRRNLNAE